MKKKRGESVQKRVHAPDSWLVQSSGRRLPCFLLKAWKGYAPFSFI